MTIDAIGTTSPPSYAAVDKAMAAKSKAAALLAADKQCKACPSTIAKDEKAVAEAVAVAHAADVKIKAETAARRGGVDLLV